MLHWLWHVYLMMCMGKPSVHGWFANLSTYPRDVRFLHPSKGLHSRRLHTKVRLHHMRSRKSFSIKRYNPMPPEWRWRRKFRQPQIVCGGVCGTIRPLSVPRLFLLRSVRSSAPQLTRISRLSYTRHQLSGPPKVVWRQTQLLITPSKASSSEKLMERKNCCKCVEDFFTLHRRPPTTGNCSRPS